MTEKAISLLRQRLVEDMTIRRLGPKTQHDYIRHVKSFADVLGRSPDKATAEDVRRYQLRLASIGTTVPTVNATNCWGPDLCDKLGMKVPVAPMRRLTFYFEIREKIEPMPLTRHISRNVSFRPKD